jgi:hypothetical protein
MWLSERVGGSGSVVAVDLDTTPLAGHGRDNLEVRELDVRELDVRELDVLSDELPTGFDLVHFRLVGDLTEAALLGVSRFREQLIERGDITADDYDRYERRLREPDTKTFLYFLTSVWGQRPTGLGRERFG